MTDFLILGVLPGTDYQLDLTTVVLVWSLLVVSYKGRRQMLSVLGYSKTKKDLQESLSLISI
jgi:hypothetical protein